MYLKNHFCTDTKNFKNPAQCSSGLSRAKNLKITNRIQNCAIIYLTPIPKASQMSYFPRGPHYGNLNRWITILTKLFIMQVSLKCGKCFYSNRVRFVAFATELSSHIRYALRQDSVHFIKKFPRWKIEIVLKFFCQ